ncbi:uncharacterized protein LOC135838903 [Planococcus citri]|uniref:uncharacterized protein LOC135838903 n=1 Tax=Planococcus citri TaxID=170843 RepID=UPI0031FA1F1D
MSNLKDELNQYLNRGDQTKNGISFGKQTFNKIFKKLETEDNEDLLNSNNQKYYQGWFECPSLSRMQKLICFCICLCVSGLFFGLSLLYIPVIVLKARKFALCFTLGSCSTLCSFAFLWGPVNYLKHLCSVERLPFTAVYFASLSATLYFAMVMQSTILTALCAVIQIVSLVWFVVTYIPGGQTGLSMFRRIFTSAVSSSVSNTLPV